MPIYGLINFFYLAISFHFSMIELKKIAPEDSLEVGKLKDEFNRYAMQMKVQWQDLSLEEKQTLYDKLRKVEKELAKYE